jgi:hypothetical protein
VELLATERIASKLVGREGITVRSAAGTPKPNPAIRSLEIARAQVIPLLKQFALLPAVPRRAKAAPKPQLTNGKSSIWQGVLR